MSVKVTGIDQAMAFIEREAEKRAKKYFDILQSVGWKVVTAIREGGKYSDWKDQTGNLRSSIGFIIVHDGKIVMNSGFPRVDGPKRHTTTVDGSKEGLKYAEELATKFPKGYVLIIVAGMEYAAYVEAIEGKAVLANGRLLAKSLHKELVAKYSAEQQKRK